MKKYISIFIIFIIIFISACELKNKESLFFEINHEINLYFREYFDKNIDYIKKECDINNLSTEGGLVEGYFEGGSLKYMKLSLFGEMGKTENNFYIINNKKVYAIVNTFEYDKPIYEFPEIIKDYKNEFYIIDNKIMEYNININDIQESRNNNILNYYQVANETVRFK